MKKNRCVRRFAPARTYFFYKSPLPVGKGGQGGWERKLNFPQEYFIRNVSCLSENQATWAKQIMARILSRFGSVQPVHLHLRE